VFPGQNCDPVARDPSVAPYDCVVHLQNCRVRLPPLRARGRRATRASTDYPCDYSYRRESRCSSRRITTRRSSRECWRSPWQSPERLVWFGFTVAWTCPT